MARFQQRLSNGRWIKNTIQNTFGLDVVICSCGSIHPYNARDPLEIKPVKCSDCDLPLNKGG